MEEKNNRSSIQFKNGSYSAIISLIAIAIFIAVNLIAAKLPASLMSISTSKVDYYALTDTTKDYLKNKLDTDIVIYELSDSKGIYNDYVNNLCKGYADNSSHIRLEKIDVAVNPAFKGKYSAESANDYSVIVENSKTKDYKLVDYSLMLTDQTNEEEKTATYFYDGEGRITAAICSVADTTARKIYQVTGHAEMSVSDQDHKELKTALEKSGYIFAEDKLSLASIDKVPDDCEILLMYNTLTDVTVKEAEILKAYLAGGGNIVLIYNNILPFISGASYYDPHTNLNAVLSDVGIAIEDSYIIEKDKSYYYSDEVNPEGVLMMPTTNIESPITSGLGDTYIISPYSSPVKQIETDASLVTYTELLRTSRNYSMTSWNDGDPYTVDYTEPSIVSSFVEADFSGNKAHVFVVASSMFLESVSYDSSLLQNNIKFIINGVNEMSGNDSSVYVEPKVLEEKYNTVNDKDVNLFSVIYLVLLPILVLAVGFAVWFIRRSK